MKNLKINSYRKNKLKLIKNGLSVMTCAIVLLSSSGCSKVETNDYYIVSTKDSYYLCYAKYSSVNCRDYSYDSVLDGKNIGLKCINGKNFDYEDHHVSTNFLSQFQIVNLSDTINNESISINQLNDLASSDEFIQIADNYFLTKEFPLTADLDNFEEAHLQLFTIGDKVIVGYDISPSRISNSMKYIYSITDLDTYKYRADELVEKIEIDSNFLDTNYITYNDAVDIINEYNKSKQKKLTK